VCDVTAEKTPDNVRRHVIALENDICQLDIAMRAVRRAAIETECDAILKALIEQLDELRKRLVADYFALKRATVDCGSPDDRPRAA
jgi:hypothetical protein